MTHRVVRATCAVVAAALVWVFLPPSIASAGPAEAAATGRSVDYYGMFMDNGASRIRVGQSHDTWTVTADRVRVESEGTITLTMGGQTGSISIYSRTDMTPDGALLSYETRSTQAGNETVQRGTVHGRSVEVETVVDGQTRTKTTPFTTAPHNDDSALYSFFQTKPGVGTKRSYEVVGDGADATTTVTVEVVGEVPCGGVSKEPVCLDILQSRAGLSTRAVAERSGRLVTGKILGMFAIELEEGPGPAVSDKGVEVPDILGLMRVETTGAAIPDTGAATARYRLASKHLDALKLADHRQAPDGDVLTVTTETPGRTAAIRDADRTRHLAASPRIQSDLPAIRDRAKAIVGDRTDPTEKARALTQWVFDTLAKENNAVSDDNALRVLNEKKGDCLSHAVLLTALLRAEKIPARVVSGIVYYNGRFFHHAWVYAYLGQWVAIDAALGMFPADARYIRLGSDVDSSDLSWAMVVPDLAVEVLDYK